MTFHYGSTETAAVVSPSPEIPTVPEVPQEPELPGDVRSPAAVLRQKQSQLTAARQREAALGIEIENADPWRYAKRQAEKRRKNMAVYDENGNEVDMGTYRAPEEEELDESARKPFRFGAEAEEKPKPKASKRRPGMPPNMHYGKDFEKYVEESAAEPEAASEEPEEYSEPQQGRRREKT